MLETLLHVCLCTPAKICLYPVTGRKVNRRINLQNLTSFRNVQNLTSFRNVQNLLFAFLYLEADVSVKNKPVQNSHFLINNLNQRRIKLYYCYHFVFCRKIVNNYPFFKSIFTAVQKLGDFNEWQTRLVAGWTAYRSWTLLRKWTSNRPIRETLSLHIRTSLMFW